jgi:hypothetical protein
MNKKTAAGLLLVGIALGCTVSAVAPVRSTSAQTPGRWGCYVVDRFPDVADAAGWEGAANITAGLNRVAANVPAGTTLALQPKSQYPSVACIKY